MTDLAPFGGQAATMTSREIADLVEARHNDVVTTIERLFDKGLLRSSRKTRRESTGGRPIAVYDLIERDTHLVVAGYSDEHRARVIDRWQQLEAERTGRDYQIPRTRAEACGWLLTWRNRTPSCNWRISTRPRPSPALNRCSW